MIKTLLALLFSILPASRPDDHKHLVGYFLDNRTEQHMVLDRESDRATVSVAATGFGFYAWAVAAQKGYITREQAIEWIGKSLTNVKTVTPQKNRGWLYHFMDKDGRPVRGSEVSSVDTAIFWASARKAASLLGDRRLQWRVEKEIAAIDQEWMMTMGGKRANNGMFCHGLRWVDGKAVFIENDWDDYNEGIIVYRVFGREFKPAKTTYDLPLFVYYYPLCFYDEPAMRDNLIKAVEYQKKAYGVIGVTACDGPDGYCINDPNIVSPLAAWAASRWSGDAKAFLGEIKYKRTTPSFHRKTGWVSKDRIGIDEGSTLMCVRGSDKP